MKYGVFSGIDAGLQSLFLELGEAGSDLWPVGDDDLIAFESFEGLLDFSLDFRGAQLSVEDFSINFNYVGDVGAVLSEDQFWFVQDDVDEQFMLFMSFRFIVS